MELRNLQLHMWLPVRNSTSGWQLLRSVEQPHRATLTWPRLLC